MNFATSIFLDGTEKNSIEQNLKQDKSAKPIRPKKQVRPVSNYGDPPITATEDVQLGP